MKTKTLRGILEELWQLAKVYYNTDGAKEEETKRAESQIKSLFDEGEIAKVFYDKLDKMPVRECQLPEWLARIIKQWWEEK